MQSDRPSLTAAAVALARRDPVRERDLPWPLSPAVSAWAQLGSRAPAFRRVLEPAVRSASFGLVDHIELRTAAIDAAVAEAVAAGATQLVVLGAGLDARAWRMSALADVTVFEVDHPATQGGKRALVEGRRPSAAHVVFIDVDFERQRLGDRLMAAGHRPGERTAWIWEGVTPYLSPEARRATLSEIGRTSAPGSVLALTYMTPEIVPMPGLRALARRAFGWIGEPLIGGVTPQTLGAELVAAGFVRRADTSSVDWASRHGGSALRARLFGCERLAVAERV